MNKATNDHHKRALSKKFMSALQEKGILSNLLNRVKSDDTLFMAIRNNYINIYYRGGNLIKISEDGTAYKAEFDINYIKSEKHCMFDNIQYLPKLINSSEITRIWVQAMPILKLAIDLSLKKRDKGEREFQQLVVRENNISKHANESEYFIVDIEYAVSGARFDMLAVKWLAGERKDGSKCQLAFIEMKYGKDSLGKKSGLKKHINDMKKIINNRNKYKSLIKEVEAQFSQLRTLGLINIKKNKNEVGIDENSKPEIVLLLANYNPRSRKLKGIVESIDPNTDEGFDLRFHVSSFAGYGMHALNMRSHGEFIKLLNQLSKRGKSRTIK